MRRVRWGVLGAAKIATHKVIPGMQRGRLCEIAAIASRDAGKARRAADALGIAQDHGSYEALLADDTIEAVYIPLPNHLHVPWTLRALEAGKHVLCEKPIALTAAEAEAIVAVRDRTSRLVQEAFMIRTHPQWERAIARVRAGDIGDLRAVVGHFSYDNPDPANIRNQPACGGGGLMDIGCYLVHASRWAFEREPVVVGASLDIDPVLGVDRRASFTLDFGVGHATGSCGTQMAPYQRVHLIGTAGRIEIEIPFNAPPDRACRIFVDRTGDVSGAGVETITLPVCDQYTIQGDRFSEAIRAGAPAPYPLEDSIRNMRVIDAIRNYVN